MDKKKPSASGGKHDEKKEENFLTKAAHTIRDKVHGLADDVKEKTHKKKKDKDKKDSKSKHPTPGKQESISDSDDDDKPAKPSHPHTASSEVKRDTGRDDDKFHATEHKPSSTTTTTITEKKDAAAPAHPQTTTDKSSSKDPAHKPADEHKDTAAAPPPSSSSRPPGDDSAKKSSANNDAKPPTDKPKNSTEGAGGDTTNKPSSEAKNTDKVHISFDGVSTVDDLLDRIDEAIERSKIIVEGGKGPINLNIQDKPSAPRPKPADLEKKPLPKTDDNQNKEDDQKKEQKPEDNKENNEKKEEGQGGEEEPIRIKYDEIHKIEDLLQLVNNKPGSRKVVLENAPNDTNSVAVHQQTNSSSTNAQPPSPDSNENDDSSAPPKSILKTSQNPSSLDTSTKTSALQDDQIHVNIEGVQNVEELLDRLDEAVQHVPIVIDGKPQGEKRQAPQAPNKNQEEPKPTVHFQKREAPKAPSSTPDQSDNDKPPEQKHEPSQGGQKVTTFNLPEHEFEGNPNDTGSPTTEKKAEEEGEEKKNEVDKKSGNTDWI